MFDCYFLHKFNKTIAKTKKMLAHFILMPHHIFLLVHAFINMLDSSLVQILII